MLTALTTELAALLLNFADSTESTPKCFFVELALCPTAGEVGGESEVNLPHFDLDFAASVDDAACVGPDVLCL